MKKLIIFLILFLLIIFRYFATRPVYQNGDMVRISASVTSDPITYSNSQLVRIAGLRIYTPLFPKIDYGDNIVVDGVVEDGQVSKAKVIKVESKKVFFSNFRKSVLAFYQKTLPEPEAGLLGGITLGSKGALSFDFYNQTKLVGVAHIVVASGTNISIVVSFLMGVLTTFLPRRKAISFVILGGILYLFMSGFDAPLIRATIMASFLMLGQVTGRVTLSWRLFFLTACLMLVYNPSWLTDLGFILSFVATASLMLFEKRIRNKLSAVPGFLREGLSTSLAAQIGVAPILLVTFGQFNILSPIINMLVLPVVPPLMILGAVGGVLGLIFPFLGKVILWLSYPMLWWFVRIVSIFQFSISN